jgi:hypothetical protein
MAIRRTGDGLVIHRRNDRTDQYKEENFGDKRLWEMFTRHSMASAETSRDEVMGNVRAIARARCDDATPIVLETCSKGCRLRLHEV